MKKTLDLIKPYITIILGALIFLYYLNWFSYGGAAIAIAVIAMVIALYYIAIGLVNVLLGEKLNETVRKIFDIASISLFVVFMFVYFLIMMIMMAQNNQLGPNGWVIYILSLIVCLCLIPMYIVAQFVNVGIIKRLGLLFSYIFLLVLLLNVLFDVRGNPEVLGNIDIIKTVIYLLFANILLSSAGNVEKKQEETQAE